MYEVSVDQRGAALHVEARFAPGVLDDATLASVTEGAEPYVRELSASTGTPSLRGTSWYVPGCASGCTVRYDFALADATALREDGVASGARATPQAPAGSWLLRPMAVRDGDAFVLTVHARASERAAFASGLRGREDERGAFVASGLVRDLSAAPYAVFGEVRARRVPAAGAALTLAVVGPPGTHAADDDAFARWTERSASAVARTFGRFPIDGALIAVLPRRGNRVGFGRALAGPLGASILVDVGAGVDDAVLRADWVLVHEMIHLGFPSLDRKHRWMEEGLATYLEPLVRARAGLTDARDVWLDFASMMPNGLPAPDDRGLDRTPTWGRVYWGGALFCFVADVEIRRRTHGARSLDDALRAILAAGGNNGARWPIERAFAVGDAATGTDVLTTTYGAWKERPVTVDLGGLFAALGVRAHGEDVTFDDAAPLAAIRAAMTTSR